MRAVAQAGSSHAHENVCFQIDSIMTWPSKANEPVDVGCVETGVVVGGVVSGK